MKKIMLVIISLIAIISLLNLIEKTEYNNAIKKCGSEKNIITKYTQQGDKYYSCKVER